MKIGQRIRQLRKSRKYTQADLAKLLGVKPTTVASWEQGRNQPLMDKVQKIAILFDIPMSELIGDKQPKNNKVVYSSARFKRIAIPIIGEIACGDPITAEENIDDYTEETFVGNAPTGTIFALRCKGHSMEPTIPDGALAIIHEQPEVENGEIAAVLNADNEATLKRVKHQGDTVMLLPDNKDYDPIILDKNHPGRILGKVIRYSVDM